MLSSVIFTEIAVKPLPKPIALSGYVDAAIRRVSEIVDVPLATAAGIVKTELPRWRFTDRKYQREITILLNSPSTQSLEVASRNAGGKASKAGSRLQLTLEVLTPTSRASGMVEPPRGSVPPPSVLKPWVDVKHHLHRTKTNVNILLFHLAF